MTLATPLVGAWILASEDDPAGTTYQDPTSSYQSLKVNGVYKSVDMLNICFVDTIYDPASNGFTLKLVPAVHQPGNIPNDQYMQWIIADARAANPAIKVLVTMGYAGDEITKMYAAPYNGSQTVIDQFAQNVVAYLTKWGLDGLDVDWEPDFCWDTSQTQFAQVFTAIGKAFAGTGLLLTMCPSQTGNLDAPTTNAYFDMVTLQVYGGASKSSFIQAGVQASLLAYGAKFESEGPGMPAPDQTPEQAYDGYTQGSYDKLLQWRLNSGNFQAEQAYQMILYQMIKGTGPTFDDSAIVATAGNPPITAMTVRHGDVLDAIQATNTGSFESTPIAYDLLQHGGNGGQASNVTIPAGDSIASISGYTGIWFGWQVVLQLTITTHGGQSHGPFGTMANATSQTPFTLSAPAGQSIVAFSGTVQTVPRASGGPSEVVTSLAVTCA